MTKKRRRKASHPLPVQLTRREGGGIALEVDGVVQSVSVLETRAATEQVDPATKPNDLGEPEAGPENGYWGLLLPSSCPRRTLLLGLGGGTAAHLLVRRCPDAEIVGIEHNREVLELARAQFGLSSLPQLIIVEADAFVWVAQQCGELGDGSRGFDLICLDLFEAGRLAQGALATPFLRQIARLMAPDGLVTVNLMVTARTPDQLRRLERVFALVWQKRLRGNLIVHGHLPSPETGAELKLAL
jgi:predicted O-methyltransferase YrrM